MLPNVDKFSFITQITVLHIDPHRQKTDFVKEKLKEGSLQQLSSEDCQVSLSAIVDVRYHVYGVNPRARNNGRSKDNVLPHLLLDLQNRILKGQIDLPHF